MIHQTVAQSPAPVQYDAALHTLAAQATTRYAGEHLRIAKGLVIALNHGATLQADGTALVQSQSEPEIVYTVNGHCDCKDATHGAPEGRCKHRWAKTLTSRAQALTAAPVETLATLSEELYGPQAAATAAHRTATQRPTAAEVPGSGSLVPGSHQKPHTRNQKPASRACAEAAFSLTLKGTMGGHDALLTARGNSFEEFAANVQRLQGLLDGPASAPPAAAPTRACPVHPEELLTQQRNAKGAWWSHPTADGWCRGK